MWFKLFVLLRLPISALCLLGYAIRLGMSSSPHNLNILGGAFALTPFAFLVFVSIQLVMFRKGAPVMAGWLLAVEVVGVLLPPVGADYVMFGKVEPVTVAGVLVGALLLWVLPNALLIYRALSLFPQPAKEESGL